MWNETSIHNYILRRVRKTDEIENDTIVVCSGNVISVRYNKTSIELSYMIDNEYRTKCFDLLDTNLITVGRMMDCDIMLTGSNCSRYQFTLRFEGEKWYIREGRLDKMPKKGVWLLQQGISRLVQTDAIYWLSGNTLEARSIEHPIS